MALRFKWIKVSENWRTMQWITFKVLKKTPKKLPGRIMFPTMHDIFPEGIDITIAFLRPWLEAGNKILLVTKPHFEVVTALCKEFASCKKQITWRFTIGSMDDEALKFWEPGAPTLCDRLNSLEFAYKSGFKTSVSCEPYLDDSIIDLVKNVNPFVTDTIWIGKMNNIKRRVDMSTWAPNDFMFLRELRNCQTDDFIRNLYNELKDSPKIRWKDSIRQVLGLPEEVQA
jgi:DNA repair photolyase